MESTPPLIPDRSFVGSRFRSRMGTLARFLSRPLALSVILTGAAIVIALAVSPARDLPTNYLRLCTWDCGWYTSIVKDGYHSVIPPVGQNSRLSNVAFFPGYPMIARTLYLAFSMPGPELPLILTAHFFCVLFWWGFFLLLRRWQVPLAAQLLAALAIFAHPAGFFLIAGYSESLFLAALLFFFYYADDENPRHRWLAVVPGFLLTATRIVGLPVVAYPLLRWLLRQREPQAPLAAGLGQPALIAGFSALGGLSFFAYCQWSFGDYRLYMQTQRVGWGIVADYGALWKWADFRYFFPYDQWATVASGVGLATAWVLELGLAAFRRRRPSALRVPLYLCATFIFYITLCGLKSLWFRSMIRYTLPWWLILVLGVANLNSTYAGIRFSVLQKRIAFIILLGVFVASYSNFELSYLADFLNGRWFA